MEPLPPLRPWVPDAVSMERRRRIILSIATYGYEVEDTPIMPDNLWDWMAQRIDRTIETGHVALDHFFAFEFSPMTGMWIHDHPELDKVALKFQRYHRAMGDYFNQRK